VGVNPRTRFSSYLLSSPGGATLLLAHLVRVPLCVTLSGVEGADSLIFSFLSHHNLGDGGCPFTFDFSLSHPSYQPYPSVVSLPPEKCVHIDDILLYIQAAEKIGMVGIHYVGYDELINSLALRNIR
jgi:hypothetical protein